MKNKKNIIILTISIIIITSLSIYLFTTTKEYTYICLNQELTKGQCIVKNYLEECTTNEEIPDGVVTNKSEILNETGINGVYCLTKNKYEPGEMLYKKDFELPEYEKVTSTDIALLEEVEVLDHGSGEEDLTRYKAYIKSSKLYAINLNTNEEKLIFDEEKIKNIAIRPYCCAGNAKLLILTTNGNVYFSKQDSTYSFNFDVTFEKLEVNDIIGFKLVPKQDYDIVKSLYGINSNGEEVLITEPEW